MENVFGKKDKEKKKTINSMSKILIFYYKVKVDNKIGLKRFLPTIKPMKLFGG